MDTMAYLAIAGFVLTAATLLVTVTKQISGIEARTKEFTNGIIKELRDEFYKQNEKLRLEIAETVRPLKSLTTDYEKKHYELELYIRDNYIEVPTFKEALNEIKNAITDLSRKIEKMGDDSTKWRNKQS